jgi:predicted RNA binding protein YcfA (HicA-like mRNA interferase family)
MWSPGSSTLRNIQRTDVERFLVRKGFVLQRGGKTSHRQYKGRGVTITIPGHGPTDLTKKHTGQIIRLLRQAGLTEKEIEELH